MPTPPPSGKEQFAQMLTTLRTSRAVQFARTNQTLLLAITCLLIVAILSVFAQSGLTSTDPGSITVVANNFTPEPTTTLTNPFATPTATAAGELAQGPTPTITVMFGPPFPDDETTATSEPGRATAISPYPNPNGEPIPDGSLPTVQPFPTSAGADRATSPPFPPLPPFPPSGGVPNQPRSTPEIVEEPNQTYPEPGNEPAPTNIPIPTRSGSDEEQPTDKPSDDNAAPTEDFPIEPIPTEDGEPTPTDQGAPAPTNEGTPDLPEIPAFPTEPANEIISGDVRWTAADSPIVLDRETIVQAGSTLTIDPGVEVRLAPDVSLVVDGTLRADGTSANPVRFRAADAAGWRSIVVNSGGRATLSGLDVRGGGASGVVVAALGGSTIIQDSRFEGNRGQILGDGGNLDIQRTTVVGVSPLSVNVRSGGVLRLIGNTINNIGTQGGVGVAINAADADVVIDVQKNAFKGSSGSNVRAQFDRALPATFQCNTFSGGAVGLSIKSSDPALNGSRIVINGNSFLGHKSYGLAADVGLDARNNWWGHASGPYHPEQNGKGTGDAIGVNLPFIPWLDSKPACTP